MNLSGIAVSVRPQSFNETINLLDALPGIEIHLKRIKAIAGVVVAELVYHYFADDQGTNGPTPPDLDTASGISDSVLQRLNPN
jgi:nitrate reductase NapAB chaperone NapD